ncbi:MAG: alcohol dehydrogenase catalytic domain-containing protein, partial [Candidatus Omnitrophica bacterium]|nr:alcohol dehydrogenase catalytic domain-containing protein [Candidatus Omnitrophota bacterium]
MKAIVIKEHGDLDKLICTEVPTPKPGRGEVLIKVKACALNHLDIWTRLGMKGISIPMPHILGCDI